jgi:hypothetical protein
MEDNLAEFMSAMKFYLTYKSESDLLMEGKVKEIFNLTLNAVTLIYLERRFPWFIDKSTSFSFNSH